MFHVLFKESAKRDVTSSFYVCLGPWTRCWVQTTQCSSNASTCQHSGPSAGRDHPLQAWRASEVQANPQGQG